jgi:hypothetical protein
LKRANLRRKWSTIPKAGTEISHGRVSWQTRWRYFAKGLLASSIGYMLEITGVVPEWGEALVLGGALAA